MQEGTARESPSEVEFVRLAQILFVLIAAPAIQLQDLVWAPAYWFVEVPTDSNAFKLGTVLGCIFAVIALRDYVEHLAGDLGSNKSEQPLTVARIGTQDGPGWP